MTDRSVKTENNVKGCFSCAAEGALSFEEAPLNELQKQFDVYVWIWMNFMPLPKVRQWQQVRYADALPDI